MTMRDRDTRCINKVFHNHLLVNIIFGHVTDIHKRWMSLPKPSIDSNNNNRTHLIKSTIKGRQLQNMSLVDMLRFNATQMFITAFDSVANDYPIDNNLLTSAVNFNNITVFNHLVDRMKMDIECWDKLLYHGNLDILRRYLEATGHRRLPTNMESNLPSAVDSGNVEFVRLLLQHLDNDYHITSFNMFRRHGVRVDMLRMLHEEFNLLFLTILWEAVLRHSAKCDMMDSVQYVLENMPPAHSIPSQLLFRCLNECAKSGNVDMFQAFIKTPDGTIYLSNSRDIKRIIEKAADRSHLSIIKHLFQHHVGNGHINNESETLILNLLVMPPSDGLIDMDQVKLRSTIFASIRNDDIVSLESDQSRHIDLTLKMCLMMSKPMTTFISSHGKSVGLSFGGDSLPNLVNAMCQPGSSITADIVCQFIVNSTYKWYSDTLQTAMKYACSHSVVVAQLLHSRFNIDYCLATALENRCHETISFIFNHTNPIDRYRRNSDVKARASDIVSNAPLSEVTFILDHMDYIRHNVEVCEWAARSPHLDVFEHVINLFTLEQLCDGQVIDRIIERALLRDRIDNVLMLQRHFGQPDQIQQLLQPMFITQLAKQNCYLTLEHHFNSTTFSNWPMLHRLRVLHSILNVAYQHTTHRVIKMCNDQIQLLTLYQSESGEPTLTNQDHDVHQASSPSSTSMETAFHSVFNDTKLGMMVMEQIGRVHKSLGINDKHLIKGSQLIDRHCLIDYIKYGATEWFLKSYSPSNVVHNSPLLDEALARCDTRAVDVLLANPKCQLVKDLEYFVKNVSCTHPHLERMIEEYIMISNQTSSSLIFNQEIMSKLILRMVGSPGHGR
ncbi:hypothetical protein SAMD00019534_024760 [Acytostelium subglobosum LB1]|uniref:hypothetical protein n=1 Tax=Acytostelium subglobosum LB1 TaxID=1410327 RepID=UPI000644D479|nr:hypothetical protein SAMD00019534_024760 [Acytostelium subglobosum LB1]GAM19301.1 hypothetical protein SAMD00019534_024760 [Acytostelium subglobosum LB1]|eukprot:XP_012757228.1 hypothetical protein SAMD00019534_024760 [Acytostelium subglobosum LB1]